MYPNITGKIRSDRGGDGAFGAPRAKIVHGATVRYLHKGVDFALKFGDPVFSPCAAQVVRISRPYTSEAYSGLMFAAKRMEFKMWYFQPLDNIVGSIVREGEVVGHAQAISKKYLKQGVTDHIHFEISVIDPMIIFIGEITR